MEHTPWKLFRFSKLHHWKVDTGNPDWFVDCGFDEVVARKVAAASESLDTLQKCLDVFQSPDMPHSLRVGNGKQPTEDTILCLRMQIAKATGGE